MTGFHTLIYLDGSAGPQVQALSADVDDKITKIVRRELLADVRVPGNGAGPAAVEPPVSFAHCGGEHFITAAGVLPAPAAGAAGEKRLLTQAIATRDPRSYGGLRPAQLFGAPFWATGPAASTTCDPIPAGPPVGRPDIKSVQAFVNRRADGARLLATLLTALSGTTRVLFLAERTEPVVMWIAAATLLMPEDAALRIDFKIFVRDPARHRHRILAVHPGLDTPPAFVDRPGNYLVMDLRTDRCSELAVTAEARRWADLFVRHDPVDVVDMVEWTPTSGLDAGAAAILAEVLLTGRPPAPAVAPAILGWLRDGPAELVAAYGPRLVSVFGLEPGVHSTEVLGQLDRATSGGDFPEFAVPVRFAWLSAELDAAARGERPSRDRPREIAGDRWGTAETTQATALTINALRAATGIGFATMLEVAGRFDIPVGFDAIGGAANAFVRFWAEHPELNCDPYAWPCVAEFKEVLRNRLNERLDERSAEPQTVGRLWAWLLSPRYPLGRLDGAIIGAQMAELGDQDRRALVARQLAQACRARDAAAQASELGRWLWRWATATAPELRVFAEGLPPGGEINPGAVDEYLFLRIHGKQLDIADLDMVADLEHTRRLRPADEAARLLASYRTLRQAVERLPGLPRDGRELLDGLGAVDAEVVKAYAGPLVTALLETPAPALVAGVVSAQPDVRWQYADAVSEALRAAAEPYVVAGAVVVADRRRNPSELRTRLTDSVKAWVTHATPTRLDRVGDLLRGKGLKTAYALWIGLRGGGSRR